MTPALHRGHVAAAAFWFPPGSCEPARVLREWEPGSTVASVFGGILLWRPSAARVRCATAPGLPLVATGSGLSAVVGPVAPGSVVVYWHGEVRCVALSGLESVNPGAWLDLSASTVLTARSLGPAPAPAPVPPGFDVRVALRRPPSPKEAEALRAAVLAAGKAEASPVAKALAGLGSRLFGLFGGAAGAAIGGAGAVGGAAAAGAGGGAAAASGWLSRLFGWGRGESKTPAPAGAASGPPLPALPPEPGWLQKQMRKLVAPLWGPLLGGAHGRHLAKLFDLFDSGKLEEALRNAIPLGGDGGPSLGPSWSLPSPRSSLQLGSMVRMPSTSIGLQSELFQQLRQLYERALQKLLAEQKWDEAVFILVELLREHARAVDLLEREGRLELAAEIAEANLAPAVAIRLWMKAQKSDRAILLARRTGTFAQAVAALKPKEPDLATALRRHWATHLADRGDYAGACTAAWEEPALRSWATRWLDEALAAGGPSGAKLIGYLLTGEDDGFVAAKERVDALLPGEGPEAIELRLAVATGLEAVATYASRALLRSIYRRLVADQFASPEYLDGTVLTRISAKLGEPALMADRPPPAATARKLSQRKEPLIHTFAAADAGSFAITDLCFHADSGLVVGLGEVGLRQYGRDGRMRAVYDEPCHALVPSASGGALIAIARRDWGVRLARINLHKRTCARWHDGKYDRWGATSDGNLWFVAEQDSFLALDMLAPQAKSLWRVNRLPGPISEISGAGMHLSVLLGGPERERWVYQLPEIRLTERRATLPPAAPEGLESLGAGYEFLSPNGTFHVVDSPMEIQGQRRIGWQTHGQSEKVTQALMLPATQVPLGRTIRSAAFEQLPNGHTLRLAIFGNGRDSTVMLWLADLPVLMLELGGATRVNYRLSTTHLALGDDRGRALVVELEAGALIRNIRVR